MGDNFVTGENDANQISRPDETMGARYGISVRRPGPNAGPTPTEPYLLPPSHGDGELTAPAISLTPLGGMMGGPNSPPPQIDGQDYRAPVPDQAGPFAQGVADAYPNEGCPVPYQV